MKLLIAADMEGITGVVTWNHVSSSHSEYNRFRKLMTADVNAAVAGAFEGGADEVIIADGHGSGHNILLEELDPRALLNAGNAAPFSMIQGVANDVDAAMFVGYHARAGTENAVLCHTWDLHIANVWLNKKLVGETGLNAAVCAYFGIPLIMVSGDQALAKEAQELIPDVEPVVVKQASSHFSAELLPPSAAQAMIREGARNAVKNFQTGKGPKPFNISAPVTVSIEFTNTAKADGAMRFPGASRKNALEVEAVGQDMLTAFNIFRSLAQLGDR
jgi:D-amino peptidase